MEPELPPPPIPVSVIKQRMSPRSIVVTLLTLSFIVASVFLGYTYWQLRSQLTTGNQQPTPSQNKTMQQSPEPLEETENWETYTALNFTFKYPSNLEQSNSGVSGPINGNPKMLVTLAESNTISEGTDAPFDGFSVYTANLGGKTFEEFIKKEKDDREKRDIEFWDAAGQTAQSTSQHSENTWTTLSGPAFPDITVYYLPLPDGKNIIALSMSKKSDNFSKIFAQILSTFQFLPND